MLQRGPNPLPRTGEGNYVSFMRPTRSGILSLAAKLIILVLAGFLIAYHVIMLHDLYIGQGLSTDATYNFVQGSLRLAIAASLLAVILGKRQALWAMWMSIAGLIATHYWAHFGNVPVEFTAYRGPLSYLKGLIFPTIITAAFLYRERRRA